MTYFAPCWSCHALGPCAPGCQCARCLDPVGYDAWADEHPDEYAAWLDSQRD